jgi:hypothetical protein
MFWGSSIYFIDLLFALLSVIILEKTATQFAVELKQHTSIVEEDSDFGA